MTIGDQAQSRTLKLTIAYDGTGYAGWQYQNDKPTVQNVLENAIEKVTGQRVRVLASGRTDAGVHALGQVVGFRTHSQLPPDVLLRALNANLPYDIAVLAVAEAPEGFHAIAHVVRKRYRYVIHDGPVRDVFRRHYAWHYPYGRLDADAMQRAATALVGTHDFRSFESSGAERKTSVRTVFELRVERSRGPVFFPHGDYFGSNIVESTKEPAGRGQDRGAIASHNLPQHGAEPDGERDCVKQGRAGEDEARQGDLEQNRAEQGRGGNGDFVVIEIEADGFLYNMVRAIVGTLVQIGRGVQPESWPGEVLRAMDRRVAGPTAPPHGLCLVRVEYETGEDEGQSRAGEGNQQ